MQQKLNSSAIKQGMSRDKHNSQRKDVEYSFALNASTESENGQSYNITNEPSNYLGITFPDGYKVIGHRNNNKDRTYYILTNPTTKKSSIGYVDNVINEESNYDVENECEDCEYKNILGTPLEDTLQTPSLTYVELINDDCHIDSGNDGLNFDINFPIKKIELKDEKLGTTLYWNDNRNPKRYLNVTNIEENPNSHYLLTQDVPCADDEIVNCILVDKLLAYPKHNKIQIEAEAIQTGGDLKLGTYEFRAVYCDLLGNEMTNYSTPTNPVSIFDENNNVLSQTELDVRTNFSIRLKVKNLDSRAFKYYKVVCIERNNVNNSASAFVEGIHPTTDDTVVYSSSGSSNDSSVSTGNANTLKRIDLNTINLIKPTYDRAKGTMVSGGVLWDYGLHKREEVNLQPVVNIFSSLVEWQTSAAKEDLYKSAIATSKYKGYMRNEVQPYSFRFFYKDGDYTSAFPMVSRPALPSDLQIISDTNYQSINANTPNCAQNERNRRWQIFNTASVTDSCSEIDTGATINETVSKSCVFENIEEIPAGTYTIQTESVFQGLESFIQNNPNVVIPGITSYIEADYPDNCTPVFGTNCPEPPVLVDAYNQISLILTEVTAPLIVGEQYLIQSLAFGDNFSNVGFISEDIPFVATRTTPTTWTNGTVVYITKESTTYIDKEVSEYLRRQAPQYCLSYKRDVSTGEYIRDTIFEDNFMPCFDGSRRIVYKRDSTFVNENCNFAKTIVDNQLVGESEFLNYAGDTVLANLLTAQDVNPSTVNANFQNKLHRKAQFFKVQKRNRDSIVLEITPNSDCPSDADNLANLGFLRYTIYDNCSSYTVLGGEIVNTSTGTLTILNTTSFPDNFIIAIDAPITTENIDDDCTTPVTPIVVYKIVPPCGCFSILTRDIETKEVEVSWSKIILNKIESYESECTFSVPEVNDCDPQPYARGTFAFWESSETYPDNKQLYDSSFLKIKPSDLSGMPLEKIEKFKSYFTQGQNLDRFGNYIWKNGLKEATGLVAPVTDLTCRPIRHPKFPDNTIAPFMYDSESQQVFSETIIFPLGITIDPTIVTTMLQVARLNGLITQKELDNIEGYEILRGDNSIHKSVIANGLGFDMYNYEKNNSGEREKWWYANFPFNDLGDDKFNTSDANRTNLIKHPNSGNSNHLYSFLSPDLLLTRPSIPTEVVLSGYQLGSALQSVVEVKDHPKYTILGSDARTLANTLAILESVFEIAVEVATTGENFRVAIGLGNTSANIPGKILASAAVAAGLAVSAANTGNYRYQWLKAFRDLGTAYNFAAMTVGTGNYNKFFKTEDNSSNYLRGLTVRKYLKDGMFNTVDQSNAERININNWLREESVLISTGQDYKFNYPNEYKNYDNNKVNSTSSKMLSSEVGCTTENDSTRNIASPYFSLKNYIPDQWGTVDSIKWLTTNYIFKLTEVSPCEPIFGGTVCISPFSWRRKTPLFRTTGMGLPDKLPFSYSEYNNIGYSKYYIDYESDTEYRVVGVPFPDIDSRYNLDCETGRNRFYVKPPSKMYLYSYGIVNFLVESEINCHFRYARRDSKDWFYPQVSNVSEWVQEKNLSISEPNTFFYNNAYSFSVSNSPYKFLDFTYDKEVWRKRNEQPNAVIYSEIENNENNLTDPWLVNKPANWYEFSTRFGELIDLKDIESSQFLARFENQLILHNAIDNLADRITPENKDIGTGGIFAKRPMEFKTTDLGFAGTQNTDICSTPYGHFWADAKRGKLFQIDQNGKDLQIISEQVGNQPTNMKQWFREHLPFKILRQFPNIDIDNKFKGLGMNLYYDDRFGRIFFTKRDYIAKNLDCLKYEEEIGFYEDCSEIATGCPENYVYNEETGLCEFSSTSEDLCPAGYTYNTELKTCTLIEVVEAECTCEADVIAISKTICSGELTNLPLTSTITGVDFTWTVVQSGVTGAITGSGNIINQTLNGAGTATYTITPYEIESGCIGLPVDVIITVNPTPNVLATPSSLDIVSGESAIISLTSDLAGTTFSWTAVNSGTSGASAGSGNTINQTITGVGTTTYTITPSNNGCQGNSINVVVNVSELVIDVDTQINIWFDDSGSMDTTLNPLNVMRNTVLKPCLLAAYNNDSDLYDSRVNVLNFSSSSMIERYIDLLATTSTNPSITRVINLAFADESNDYGAEVAYSGIITSQAATDIAKLRNNIASNPPNYLVGVIFQVSTGGVGTPTYPGFRTFVNNLHTGVVPFTGTNGLSDKPEIGYTLDVIPGSTPNYYANLIITALNNLGFTLDACE